MPSAPTFAPPLSSTRPRSPSPSPTSQRYLSTPAGELAFFRALIQHRPVGLDKHWEMIGVALHLRDHVGEDARIEQGELWDKFRELYDEETLRTTWEGEQIDAMEEEEEDNDSNATPAESPEEDWINVRFPRKDFTLLIPPSKLTPTLDESLFASLADRISQRAEREEGAPASPPPGPVREFSLELPDEEVEEEEEEEEEELPRGRGARGKGRESRKATESESPKKKKVKVAPKEEEEGTELSGSDLSELEDDEEEEAEEEEDDGEEGTEASRASDGEDYEDTKASTTSRQPSSKRKRATRSASAPTSDAASTSHMSAADLKKEKAKLAMRVRRAKIKAEKEAAGGEAKPKEKAKRKRG